MIYLNTFFYAPLEIKWLKLNLLESYDHIDKFIICEHDVYHTGKHREFIFHKYQEELPEKLRDKIIYLKCYVRNETVDAYNDEETIHRINEPAMRNHVLKLLNFNDDDILINVDADEIIYGESYDYILHELVRNQVINHEGIIRLRLHQFFYKPTYLWEGLDITAPIAAFYKTLNDNCPNSWRSKGRTIEKKVGCHFSWCMTIDEMMHKLNTYGHPKYRFCADKKLLENAVKQKIYPFEPKRDFRIREISLKNAILPKHLSEVFDTMPSSRNIQMDTSNFSVILTAYKRDYFEEQLKAIYNQTVQPSKVYIWQNGDAVDIEKYKLKYPSISLVCADENYGFFGRWAFALLMTTEFIVILDDDTIPQEQWFEYAIGKCKDTNCIIGGNGRFVRPLNDGTRFVGDWGICKKDTYVDFVGHCWVFRREWLNNMWKIQPCTYKNGEDIHFCATCQILQGIRSLVPKQEGKFASDTGGPEKHSDANASQFIKGHDELRKEICEFFLDLGWKTSEGYDTSSSLLDI